MPPPPWFRSRFIDVPDGTCIAGSTFPLSDGACCSASRYGCRSARWSRAVPHLSAAYPDGADPEAFVFPGEEGGVTRHNVWYGRYWRPTVRAMHEADPSFPLARFHDLRHTAASLLINAGADPRAVAERLGHSNVMLTLNTYSHLFETRNAELTDALDATYEGRQRTTAEPGGAVVSLDLG